MNKFDIDKYQTRLEEERAELIAKLEKIAFRDDENPADWVPRRQDQNISNSEAVESLELAEEIEMYEKNTATVKELESRLNKVKAALKRIENGTYGIDEVTGEEISPERLEANPAARTSAENATQLEQTQKPKNEVD